MTREELLKIAKPMLFNTDMVRAILEDRKTVTRRAIKYKYSNTEMCMRTDKYGTRLIEIQKDVEGETHGKHPDGRIWQKLLPYIEKIPSYKKGDILYVRETWCELSSGYEYKADGETIDHLGNIMRWHPSIHMPKEAARIFLKVKDVRVERLQDMRSEDALKEGIKVSEFDLPHTGVVTRFKHLWNSTIKKSDLKLYGWNANPWVWVIEFERITVE